jgi:PHD/YefM family antitoxin component YafN of YafNO toxin-antitoxin module
MTLDRTSPSHPRGEALARELVTIHQHLRHDLQKVRELARRLAAGSPATEIRAGIAELSIKSPVWALRLGCRRYCEFVHLHHGLEDRMLFPGLRRAHPEVAGALDKLEADHEAIAILLADVDSAVILTAEDQTHRAETVLALDRLADHLLAHLDFEEASLTPILRQLDGWPS